VLRAIQFHRDACVRTQKIHFQRANTIQRDGLWRVLREATSSLGKLFLALD
jgi:hypothetical protein